ncbi:hypothetical protein PVAND_015150 [Polypedilum vanderplanki]|uniref:Ankyrin repeat protein n=1 Tax=Polypedilum vanderplanki TaxID=319348 RepID=A0A9J6BB97_POLVA|nr:hypothetical protein PVAND_015150 [Polypedilum vanderplanki]
MDVDTFKINFNTFNYKNLSIHEALSFTDRRGYNYLMLAAESGHTAALNHFISLGLDVNSTVNHETAATLAYFDDNFDALAILLENNSIFPPNFNSELSESLHNFLLTMEEFHSAMQLNQKEKMKQIADENPKIRHFYNTNNLSATLASLLDKNFDIYEFLLSLNITIGPFEMFENVIESLSNSEKQQLRAIHEKHAKGLPENHLIILEASTFVSHDEENVEAKMSLIRNAYQTLNSIDKIRPLLIVIALARCFKIIMDFKSDSVQRIDPTSDKKDKGIFYMTRHIIIGARNLLDPELRNDTIGVIIHEICHYALDVVFSNNCKPYLDENRLTIGIQYHKILKRCQMMTQHHEIIGSVFNYESHQYYAELIVRVPQLMTIYSNDERKLRNITEKYFELFQFYETKVLPEIESASENIGRIAENAVQSFAYGMKKKVSKWRKLTIFSISALPFVAILVFFLVYERTILCENLTDEEKIKMKNSKIEYFGVELKFEEFYKDSLEDCGKLKAEDLKSLLENGYLNLTKVSEDKIEDYVNFQWENLARDLKKSVLTSNVDFQGIFTEFFKLLGLEKEEILKFLEYDDNLDSLEENRPNSTKFKNFTILVDVQKNSSIKTNFQPFSTLSIEFQTYSNTSTKLQTNSSIASKLKRNLITKTLSQLHSTDIQKIIRKSPLKVHKKFEISKSFYYTRSFKIGRKNFKFQQIFNSSSILLLSDHAGAGKTTSFKHIAVELKNLYPSTWVVYVDLKMHLDTFKKYNLRLQNIKEYKIEDFLIEILDLKNFDKILFENFFNINKMIFLWDGVDEISPNYKNFITDLILKLKKFENIQQWISTRPVLIDELKLKLKVTKFYELDTFTDENRKKFVKEYLEFVYDAEKTTREFTENIFYDKNSTISYQLNETIRTFKKIEEHMKNVMISLNNPLLFVMIANMSIDNSYNPSNQTIHDFKNLYSVYNHLVLEKLAIIDVKGKIVQTDRNKAMMGTKSFLSLHQQLAIKYIAPDNELNIMTDFKKDFTNDTIIMTVNRFGIVFLQNIKRIEFVHRTFAEFFVAKFLVDEIYHVSEGRKELSEEMDRKFALLKKSTITSIPIRNFLFEAIGDENKKFNKIVRCAARKLFTKESEKNSDKKHLRALVKFLKNDLRTIFEVWNIKRNYDDDCQINKNETILPEITNENLDEFFPFQRGQIYYKFWKYGFEVDKNFTILRKFNDNKTLSFFEFLNFAENFLTFNETGEIFKQNFEEIFELKTTNLAELKTLWEICERKLIKNDFENILRIQVEKYYRKVYSESSKAITTDTMNEKIFFKWIFYASLRTFNVSQNLELICPNADEIEIKVEDIGSEFSSQFNQIKSILSYFIQADYSANFITDVYDFVRFNSNLHFQRIILAEKRAVEINVFSIMVSHRDSKVLEYFINEYKKIFDKNELMNIIKVDVFKNALAKGTVKSIKIFFNFLTSFVFVDQEEKLIANIKATLFQNLKQEFYILEIYRFKPFINYLKKHMSEYDFRKSTLNLENYKALDDMRKIDEAPENVINFLIMNSDFNFNDIRSYLIDYLIENSENLTKSITEMMEIVTIKKFINLTEIYKIHEIFEDFQLLTLTKMYWNQNLTILKRPLKCNFDDLQSTKLITTTGAIRNPLLESFLFTRFFINKFFSNETENIFEILQLFFDCPDKSFYKNFVAFFKDFLKLNDYKKISKNISDVIVKDFKNVVQQYVAIFHTFSDNEKSNILLSFDFYRTLFAKNHEILEVLFKNFDESVIEKNLQKKKY